MWDAQRAADTVLGDSTCTVMSAHALSCVPSARMQIAAELDATFDVNVARNGMEPDGTFGLEQSRSLPGWPPTECRPLIIKEL